MLCLYIYYKQYTWRGYKIWCNSYNVYTLFLWINSFQAFLINRILKFVETKTDPVEKGIVLVGIPYILNKKVYTLCRGCLILYYPLNFRWLEDSLPKKDYVTNMWLICGQISLKALFTFVVRNGDAFFWPILIEWML